MSGKLSVKEIKEYFGINPERRVEIISWTPEDARLILEFNNDNNRPVSKKDVNDFLGKLKRKEFSLHPDNVSFNDEGTITNGQHRLIALAKSDVESVEMGVMFGVEHQADMDTGKRRTLADNVIVQKDKLGLAVDDGTVRRISTVAKTYFNFAKGASKAPKLSYQQEVDAIEYLKDDLIKCDNADLFKNEGGVSQAGVLAAFLGAYLNGVSIENLYRIKKVLVSGVVDTDVDKPIIKLRDFLLTTKGGGHALNVARYCKTCDCIRKVLSGTIYKRISLSEDDVIYAYKGIPHVS